MHQLQSESFSMNHEMQQEKKTCRENSISLHLIFQIIQNWQSQSVCVDKKLKIKKAVQAKHYE